MFKTQNIVDKNYIQEIDCLRAIAVVLVVLFIMKFLILLVVF